MTAPALPFFLFGIGSSVISLAVTHTDFGNKSLSALSSFFYMKTVAPPIWLTGINLFLLMTGWIGNAIVTIDIIKTLVGIGKTSKSKLAANLVSVVLFLANQFLIFGYIVPHEYLIGHAFLVKQEEFDLKQLAGFQHDLAGFHLLSIIFLLLGCIGSQWIYQITVDEVKLSQLAVKKLEEAARGIESKKSK